MTGPRIVARLLIAAPQTAEDGTAVAALLRPYAPTALHCVDDAVADEAEQAVATALDLGCTRVKGADALQAIEAVAMRALGGCIAVLVPGDAVPGLLARALGAPPEAATRLAVMPRAVSVLECDDARRWSVVRVNEGAWPFGAA